jgi:hypothetical protein
MKLTTLKNQIASLRSALEAIEAALAKEEAKRAAKKGDMPALPASPDSSDAENEALADKPKRAPNSWIVFTQRVDALLKANNVSGKATENKQFASSLKMKKVYSEWTDEEILAEKVSWVKPEKPEKPETSITNDVDKIMDEITSDSGSVSGSEEKSKKKRGRPSKKTE